MKRHASTHVRAGALTALLLIALGAGPAFAWKPIMHVYLAEEAREDLMSRNGAVFVQEVDFLNRTVIGSFGTQQTSSAVYEALRDYPAYYRAGVLGPDAYPDLLFGQQTIHTHENDHGGTNAWLQHLSNQVRTPQERAFYLGFLAHAAGDMFGHTFVNHYSGGPFQMGDNARKHIVVEGYVGGKTPPLRGNASYIIDTSAVNGFIHDTMIDARRSRDGQTSNHVWALTRQTAHKSLPGVFTRLRAGLEDMTAAYYAHVRWLREQHHYYNSRCNIWSPLMCTKAAYYRGLLAGYQSIGGLSVLYLEAWIRDIDRGLRAWPETSTELANALMMKPDRKMDLPAASAALGRYRDTYLCPMVGAPNAVCNIITVVSNHIAHITSRLEFIKALKDKLFETLVKTATGRTPSEWKQFLEATATDVDLHLPKTPISTSSELNGLMAVSSSSPAFDMYRFAPAYNTMTSIKLSFLDTRAQWQTVLGRAGWTPSNPTLLMGNHGFNGQLLLGYIQSLDTDNQWLTPSKMFLAHDCGLFSRLFMQQTGDSWGTPTFNNQCAFIQSLQAVSPQLQCGGFDIHASLNRVTSGIGGVLKLEGTYTTGGTVSGTPRHVYIHAGTSSTTVRFSDGLQNVSSGVTVHGTRVEQRSHAAPTQVGTCGSGQQCSNFTCTGSTAPPPGTSFTYIASNTSSATVNTANHGIYLAAGQTLHIGTCGVAGASGSGDTYLRLFNSSGSQVAANDDACGGLLSNLSYTVPAGASGTYQVRAGCYSSGSCAGTVAWTIRGSFSYSATNTSNATVNTVNHPVYLVSGQRIQVGTCGLEGATGSGDTYLRFHDAAGTQVAGNDDACGGRLSDFSYTPPVGATGTHQIRAGCFSSGSCSGTVAYLIGG
jgi:hypothetical protein